MEIHNRKGCLYEAKGVLPTDTDAVIPNPHSIGASPSPTQSWLGGGRHFKAPSADGRAFGLPQTTAWRDGVKVTASEAVDLQPLMDCRAEGYNGADVATSFRAPPFDGDGGKPHTMWLLGDTFLGKMEGNKRLPGYFVHNSVATAPVWPHPAAQADPAQVVFWHNVSEAGGCPASLFRVASEKARTDENECHEGGEYLWPVSGMGVDLQGLEATNPSKLVLLATRWAYIPWIEEDVGLSRSVFNFEVKGTTLIVVDNAHAPPPQWVYRTRDLPGTGPSDNWFAALAPATPGVEVATRPEEQVYLMGTTGKPPAEVPSQILGRVPLRGLLDLSLDGMEVWSTSVSSNVAIAPSDAATTTSGAAVAAAEKEVGANQSSTWAPLAQYLQGDVAATTLVAPVFTGISLHYSDFLETWYSVAIDWMSKRALLLTAPEVTGPWASTPVYDLPAPFNGTKLMAYTGKAHPELAADNEIVFTYVANTPGVVYPLFEAGADVLYVPRFVRLRFGDDDDKHRSLRTRRRRRQKLKRHQAKKQEQAQSAQAQEQAQSAQEPAAQQGKGV